MPYEAYQIGISFVSDASRVQGAADALVRGLEKVLQAEQRAQTGFNDMVASMRGAARVAESLASTMGRVAKYAQEAAAASARIKPGFSPGGAAAASPDPMPRPAAVAASTPITSSGGSYVSPYSAAASVGGPQRLLPFIPPPMAVPVGAPYVPGGTAMVAVGSAFGGGGASFANPGGSVGGLVPAGGRGMGPPAPPGSGVAAAGSAPIPLGRLPFIPNGGATSRLPTLGSYGRMMGAYVGYETVKGAFEQGADVGDILAKMAAMQVQGANGGPTAAFTPTQIAAAQTQAMATMRRVPGLGYGQGLDVILQTAGLLGNSTKALELAPQLSFNAQVLSRYGKGDAIGQVEKAVQAGELTGLTGKDGQIDVPRLLDFVNRLTRTTVAMGGQLDIGKYLTGIRQFGLGAEAADLDFTTATLPAYMKIMGEAKAGTALTSLQQVLLAPAPNTRATKYQQEQERIGLRDKKGGLYDADMLKSNTQDYFIQRLLPTLNAAGFKTPGEITEEIQRLLPRQTVDRLAGAGLMDRALIQKEVDRNLAQQRAGDAPLAKMLADSPGAQMKALSEGFKALEAVTTQAAMGPTLDILDRLTKTLQNVTDYVKGHPDDVKMFANDVDAIVRVMIGAATGIGKVWSYLPGPLKSMVAGAVVGGTAGTIIPGAGTVGGAIIGGGLGLINGTNNSMQSGANNLWGIKPPPGFHQDWSGAIVPNPPATIQKQSYETGAGSTMQPIHVTFMVDGQVLGQHVETYQAQRAARPSAFGNRPDPMEVVPRPAASAFAI